MTFKPEWRAAVLAGTKTTTIRARKLAARGDAFELEGARFVVTDVAPVTLAHARAHLWREEGMASSEEFEHAWRAGHPTRGFRGADQVWLHRFRRAS